MRAATFMFVCSIFCVIFLSVIAQAQNSLTHDTGPLKFTVIDNGYIGDDGTGTYGGVVFNGNVNAMFTAGFIGGNLGFGGTYGMVGSFIDGGGTPVIQDYFNITPFSGFYSDPYFNQISSAETGFTPNPGESAYTEHKSKTGQNCIFNRKVITNNTLFDITNMFFGIFADWDVGGSNFALNRGGYDPQRNMLYQYENGGAVDPNYYGILPVNVDPNTVRGTVDKDIVFTSLTQLRLDIFNLMTSTDFTPITEDGNYRTYISTGPYTIPSTESLTLDYAFVAGTDLADLQANAQLAIEYAINLPVELTSFTANVNNEGSVVLKWSTATEINNLMFEIERRSNEEQYSAIGYVEGYGTTTEPQEYSYIDNTVGTGTYYYRLKQIDFSGQYEYSDEIEIEVNGPLTFGLQQNYPNPFNPSTQIKYSVPENGFVNLSVHNLVGEEVRVLVSETVDAGFYEVTFNAANLPSGTYFYRLQTSNTVQLKKMILLK
jgi:hypothetical protein